MATDLLATTDRELVEQYIETLADLRDTTEPVCHYSESLGPKTRELKQFLMDKLYHHPHLELMAQRSRELIRFLFERLTAQPDLLPERFRAMLEESPVEIVAADYIAGMTDRYAERQAEHLK